MAAPGFSPASVETGFRRAIELIADRLRRFAAPLARGFEPRLAAGARLARLGEPLLHLAQRLLAPLKRRLGQRQIVAGLGALALGGGDGVEQLDAALLDLGGEIGQRGQIGAGFFLARAQGEDLFTRIVDALAPQLLLGADRLQPLLPHVHFALEAFERGFGARRGLAALSRLALRRFERRFQTCKRGEFEQTGGDLRAVHLGLVVGSPGADQRFDQRAERLAAQLRLVLGSADGIARAVELGMRRLGLLA